jgi:hypothetical protein
LQKKKKKRESKTLTIKMAENISLKKNQKNLGKPFKSDLISKTCNFLKLGSRFIQEA